MPYSLRLHVLQSLVSQRAGQDWETELNWVIPLSSCFSSGLAFASMISSVNWVPFSDCAFMVGRHSDSRAFVSQSPSTYHDDSTIISWLLSLSDPSWCRLSILPVCGDQLGFCWPPLSLSSVQYSHSVVSSSLQPHGLQHARFPCPSPTPGVYSNSCPLSRWCHYRY